MQEGTYSSVAEKTFSDRTLLHGCGHPATPHKCGAGNRLPKWGRICSFTERCVVERELTVEVLHFNQSHCDIFIEVIICVNIIHCCIRYVVQFVIQIGLSIFAMVVK
jgi:hypothetical protein